MNNKYFSIIIALCGMLITSAASANPLFSPYITGPSVILKPNNTKTYRARHKTNNLVVYVAVNNSIGFTKPNGSTVSSTNGGSRSIEFTQSGYYQILANYNGEVLYLLKNEIESKIVDFTIKKRVYVCAPWMCI